MSFKKSSKILILLFALFAVLTLSAICLAGCAGSDSYDGQFKVTFELEDGKYQNCEYLTHYYDFKEGSSRLITDPEVLTKNKFVREDYTLEGWYRTKTMDGDVAVYTDRWDFANDRVTGEQLTLYAHWKRNIKHTYDVCYRDETTGELVVLNSYEAAEGAVFKDVLDYANTRPGYTAMSYMDENGNPWDENFRHPGGEEDLAVKVVVSYIEGEFALVRTADELEENVNKNIYLMNDIDFGGADFNGFADYKKIFRGNGYTVSNFNLTYDAGRNGVVEDHDLNDGGKILCLSLFGRTEGAEITDVKFTGITVTVSTTYSSTDMIIVAPICVKMTDTVIRNVSFEGTFGCTRLPNGFDKEENLITVTDNAYYFKDDASEVENFECTVVNNV